MERMRSLALRSTENLTQDSFYRKHSPEQVILAHKNLVDFDHPDAIDMPLFASVSSDIFWSCDLTS